MRRLLYLAVPALLAAVVSAQPASAIPGPDPEDAPPEFSIVVTGTHAGETELFDMLDFARADGWDFGDREAYRCAWVEYIVDSDVQFILTFDRLSVPGHDANYIVINDKGGLEDESGGGGECGFVEDGSGTAQTWDGSPLVQGGASFTVYKDGAPLVTYSLPAVSPVNDETFWSIGDEPGEAYMWYIEEGEADDAVVRFTITPVAPGVSLTSLEPEPSATDEHRSRVTLRLSADIRVFGYVRVPDGTDPCRADRIVLIQRRVSGNWETAGRDRTTSAGYYALHIRPREGTYRARVLERTLASGDICLAATSEKRVYR